MGKLQNAIHSHFRQEKSISEDAPIQRILANHFFENKSRYEFLDSFIQQSYNSLVFQRIIDIDVGVDHKLSNFPEKFSWLKDNVDEIELHGKNIHLTEILELGDEGGLIFGEIYAEFKFNYPEAAGTCVIGFGFPNFYTSQSPVEFEAKITSLTLHASYAHLSKKPVSRYLLQQFQENKHFVFNDFVSEKKADPRKRTSENQYYLIDVDGLE